MEGWRLGYIVAPEEIIKKIVSFNQMVPTCVPGFIQKAGVACLENEADIKKENLRIWNERRDAALKLMEASGFEFVRPDVGMYIFAKHKKIKNSGALALELLDKGVAVAPGCEFGPYDNFIRLTLCRQKEEIEEAVFIISKHIEKLIPL